MNRNEVTLLLLADYSKSFDTVDHKTLLHKLHSLQFSHSSLHLMNIYLTERKQFVQIDDKRSPLARVFYAKLLEANINSLESRSKKRNLVFNTDKTKTILFQLGRCHKNTILITQNYKPSRRKTPSLKEKLFGKVLRIKFHQNSSWKDQIAKFITKGYSPLRTLKKTNRLTPFHV